MFDDATYTPSQTVQAISDTIVNTTGITADSAKINTSDYNETVGATGTDEIQKDQKLLAEQMYSNQLGNKSRPIGMIGLLLSLEREVNKDKGECFHERTGKRKILWSISRNIYRNWQMRRCRRNWKTAGGNGLVLSGTDSSEKTAKRNVCATAGDRTFRNPKEGRSVSGNGTESTPGRKSRCDSSGGRTGYPAGI